MSEILHKEVMDPSLVNPIVPHEIPNKKKSPKVDLKEEPKATERELFTKRKSREELREMTPDQRRKYWKWLRDRESETVKCTFRNYESPGEKLEFATLVYPGQPVETHTFEEGKTYEVPLYVLKHINENCWYPQYEYVPGGKYINVPNEKPTNMRITKKIRRFGLQVIDADDYIQSEYGEAVSSLVKVEHISYKNRTKR